MDLSFELKVTSWNLPPVNEATKEKSPAEAIEQVGTVMSHIIKALAKSPLSGDPIHFSKLDINDGLWRMVCAVFRIIELHICPAKSSKSTN